jgi:tetratricopeptide (TPR) repeat protein
MQCREAKFMKKYFILSLLFVLAVGLSAPLASAQTTGRVKGVCRDSDGKPIPQADVEWVSIETGQKYSLKTNNKGEYFSLGVVPGKYNVKLSKDGKQLFTLNGITVTLDDNAPGVDIDLKKERANQAAGQGLTPEQIKAKQEADAKAAAEAKTLGTLSEKSKAAAVAIETGDYDTAITTLNEANQLNNTYAEIWASLGDAHRLSAPKQTDPAEKQKRYEAAAAEYQKAIEIRTTSAQYQKDPAKNNQQLAAYYNNLADVYAKSNKVDDSVATYNKGAQLDPTHAATFYFNEGAVLTNAGKVDDAIVAFDKVIAADPTKAAAYYWKGVNLIGKATLKGDKMIAPDGTAEAFQKYLELEPDGKLAQPAKDMLASIGATVETGYGKKKPPAKKSSQ